MIKIKEKLTVLFDQSGVFSDISNACADYTRGNSIDLPYISATDYFYVGFEKPINIFYTEFNIPSIANNTLLLSYYNGSSFVSASGMHDETEGFTRSGFIRWDRGLANEVKTTIDSKELYWYRIGFSADFDPITTSIKGLNIVFSDDQDLKRELFEINKFLPSGASTHILSHVASRDEIIQHLNIIGKTKRDPSTGWLENITSFDLLDISEVKLASTYLTMGKIFMSVFDDPDDYYANKADMYRKMGLNTLSNINLKVDSDDDGKYDAGERGVTFGRIIRL